MTELCEIVITAPDPDWLAAFTGQLVLDRLCAGGHQITQIRSIYTWDGEVVDRTEARVALHTRVDHLQAIIDRTNAEHPYVVPCVVSLPITGSNPEYAAWILAATEPQTRGTVAAQRELPN